jgi:hypothetical protein
MIRSPAVAAGLLPVLLAADYRMARNLGSDVAVELNAEIARLAEYLFCQIRQD